MHNPKSKTRSATASDDQLEVKQLLEVREYKDGSIQKDFASAAFMGIDENGRAATVYYTDMDGIGTGSGNGVIVTATLYYTVKTEIDDLYTINTFRVNRSTSVISNNSQNLSISKLTHGYHIVTGFQDLGKVSSVYSPAVRTLYTLYSENSNFHNGFGASCEEIYAGTIVDTNKGSVSAQFNIKI